MVKICSIASCFESSRSSIPLSVVSSRGISIHIKIQISGHCILHLDIVYVRSLT